MLLLSSTAFAIGTPQAIDPAGMQRLVVDSGGSAQISLHRSTGAARFVRIEAGSLRLPAALSSSPADLADAFLAQYGSIFGIRNAKTELVSSGTVQDHLGTSHIVYSQFYQGVPVFGGELRVHFDRNGELTAVNGSFVPDLSVVATPSFPLKGARDRAVRTVISQQTVRSTGDIQPVADRLLVMNRGLVRGVPGSNHLVFEIEVANPVRTIREFVYVDALDGRVVDQITGIHEGTFALDRKVSEVSLANVVWEDSAGDPDPIPAGWEGGSVNQVEAWQNEIDGARETYHLIRHITNDTYFSYDGVGATMRTVNNDPGISCPNANWNGVSTNYCDGTASDDVVTHEWGHAYTDFTHNLIYAWQSGALNESISDIWGEVTDLVNGRGTDAPGGNRTDGSCSILGPGGSGDNSYRWLMGEDAWAFGGAIRDMWTPTCAFSPGKVSDAQYWCSTGDSGGVHFNSGVPNHAFALLTDGGTYNGQTISAIGMTKAAHIFWRSQSVYQGPTTDFPEHADSLEASCADLIGAPLYALDTGDGAPVVSGEVIDAGDCVEVADVIAAVEYRLDPVQCGFEDMLDPDAPPLCDGLGDAIVVGFEDWESGLGDWVVGTRDVTNPATFDTPDWAIVGDLPDARAGMGAFVLNSPELGDCVADDETGVLFLQGPGFTIDPGSPPIHVAVDHWMSSEAGWDGGNFKISVNGGDFETIPASAFNFNPYNDSLNTAGEGNTNPMEGEEAFTGANEGSTRGSWGQSQLSLEGIAGVGDEVAMRFEMGQDGCNGAVGWYVDEVQLYVCTDEVPTETCGNGLPDAGEECDDGNMADGDGCSATCVVEDGWECTDAQPPTDPENVVDDFGFELGTPNPAWVEASTNFGTPLCDEAACGTGTGTGAFEGDWWSWFGGIATYEMGSVAQSVEIPSTATDLVFQLEQIICDSAADYVQVEIDGNPIFTSTGADPICGDLGYSEQTVDISGFADDSSHDLVIVSEIFANNGAGSNFFVDNVVISDNAGGDGEPSVCTLLEFVGGESRGIDIGQVLCENLTTHQRILSGPMDGNDWNCRDMGLHWAPGDTVRTGAAGTYHGDQTLRLKSFGTTGNRKGLCVNSTERKRFTLIKTENPFNCEDHGLEVSIGDRVSVIATGRANVAE